MTETTVDVPGMPRLRAGQEARELATVMYDRVLDELSALSADEWEVVTACAPWTVADVVRHLIGAAKGHASMRQFARQAIYGARHKKQHGGNDMDAMNALQVADHSSLGPSELIEELRAVAPKAVMRRMRRRPISGRFRIPIAPGGSTAVGMPDDLRLGHLFAVVLTRDVFLHRVDIARALGRDLAVDAIEGRLIADVVAEWAGRHGAAFQLDLGGPAGGRYEAGSDGPVIAMDAVEFCWVLSGRGEATHDLLATRVLF